jgi:hypothetical protein
MSAMIRFHSVRAPASMFQPAAYRSWAGCRLYGRRRTQG